MSATLTVPSEFVPELRSGLYGEWGFAAEELSTLALQVGGAASLGTYREVLERFDAGRALLDLVGWGKQLGQAEVRVDLGGHELYAALVIRALRNERLELVARLEELPRHTSEDVREEVRRRIGALDNLIASAQDTADRLKPGTRRLTRPSPWRSRPGFHRFRRR